MSDDESPPYKTMRRELQDGSTEATQPVFTFTQPSEDEDAEGGANHPICLDDSPPRDPRPSRRAAVASRASVAHDASGPPPPTPEPPIHRDHPGAPDLHTRDVPVAPPPRDDPHAVAHAEMVARDPNRPTYYPDGTVAIQERSRWGEYRALDDETGAPMSLRHQPPVASTPRAIRFPVRRVSLGMGPTVMQSNGTSLQPMVRSELNGIWSVVMVEYVLVDANGIRWAYCYRWEDDRQCWVIQVTPIEEFNWAGQQHVYDSLHIAEPGTGIIVGTYGEEIYYKIHAVHKFNRFSVQVSWAGVYPEKREWIPREFLPPEFAAQFRVDDPNNEDAFTTTDDDAGDDSDETYNNNEN